MKKLLLYFILFLPFIASAQRDAYYLPASAIEDSLRQMHVTYRYWLAACLYLNINEYAQAMCLEDSMRLANHRKPYNADSLRLQAVDARKYILDRARNERVIIFNEAHLRPQHRVFVESLLPSLYALGFKYMGMELLYPGRDSALNARGYPSLYDGFYINEPECGNLLRTALGRGFHVFGYEAGTSDEAERERQQAINISKVIKAHPEEKFIIYCGYQHAYEDTLPGRSRNMAGWLKAMTDIDPFTIEQVQLSEMDRPVLEDQQYNGAEFFNEAVFIDSTERGYGSSAARRRCDAYLYHPRTFWVNGRPGWVFRNGRRPYFLGHHLKVKFPCLVLVYHSEEDTAIAIPADVMELVSKMDKKPVALAEGAYTIILKGTDGKERILHVSR